MFTMHDKYDSIFNPSQKNSQFPAALWLQFKRKNCYRFETQALQWKSTAYHRREPKFSRAIASVSYILIVQPMMFKTNVFTRIFVSIALFLISKVVFWNTAHIVPSSTTPLIYSALEPHVSLRRLFVICTSCKLTDEFSSLEAWMTLHFPSFLCSCKVMKTW